LFEINTSTIKLSDDVDYDKLVSMTKGYSGADISNVCREAALMPMRRMLDEGKVAVHDLPKFKDIMMSTPMSMRDLTDALKNIKTSVSNTNLEEFTKWFKDFGSI